MSTTEELTICTLQRDALYHYAKFCVCINDHPRISVLSSIILCLEKDKLEATVKMFKERIKENENLHTKGLHF